MEKYKSIVKLIDENRDKINFGEFGSGISELNPNENGEYPVYRAFADIKVKYAEDFLDFLKGRITDEW